MNTSISRCLKDEFKAYEKIGGNRYMLSWGVEPEVERVSIYDEETGEHSFTGEVIETDWVTYESGVYDDVLSMERVVTAVRKSAKREVKISEWKALFDGMGTADDEQLPMLKKLKTEELMAYDNSSDVNDCIILYNGEELHYWASKTERNDLKNAVRDCISMGRETYRLDLRDKGISITLPCELLLQMMAALEVYAIECFNKTTDHDYAINACDGSDAVVAYEFRGVGYPEKLRFEV